MDRDEELGGLQGRLDVRYEIECTYGEAKGCHGLRRCRYPGWMRYASQAYLTAIALNPKRMVEVLTGVNFRREVVATAWPQGGERR